MPGQSRNNPRVLTEPFLLLQGRIIWFYLKAHQMNADMCICKKIKQNYIGYWDNVE